VVEPVAKLPATDEHRVVAGEAAVVEYCDGDGGWFARGAKTVVLYIGNRRLQWANSATIW
jgi:hypothetical protein